MPPLFMAAIRQLLGGILLCSFFLLKGHKLPSFKEYKAIFWAGFLMIAIGNGFVTWGVKYVSSGITALLCSLTPIWVFSLSFFISKDKRLNWQIIAGTFLGFFGMLLIFFKQLGNFASHDFLFGIAAIVLANVGWAIGTIVASNNSKTSVNPAFSAGLQMITAGIILAMVCPFFENIEIKSIQTEAYYALIYLVLFGSMLAYAAYLYALKHLSAKVVSSYAYINTLVALALGYYLASEALDIYMIAGAAITILGVYFVNMGGRKLKLS